ncbi:MAG: MepB family protein [Colwellia sp.]|nr:MepB family protein [Colwellia sp.]
MECKNYRDEFESFLIKGVIPAGYKITKAVELDPVPESSKYEGLVFSLDNKDIVYRKGKVTPDRPGAFLAAWQRPSLDNIDGNKPIPLKSDALDYLFIFVEEHSSLTTNELLVNRLKHGMFIFPVSLLIEHGIVSSTKNKGKTGFRVFPPWSDNRGIAGTRVFSDSGKKTQRWQLPYFIEINDDGLIDKCKLNNVLRSKCT